MKQLMILLLCVMHAGLLFGQDKLIKQGIELYQQGEYRAALNQLKIGLAEPEKTKKSALLAEGYLYRARAYTKLLQGNEPGVEPNYFSKAGQDLILATKAGPDAKTANLIELEKTRTVSWLEQSGLHLLNESGKRGLKAEHRWTIGEIVVEQMQVAQLLAPGNYQHADFESQALLLTQDSTKALERLYFGINLFEKSPPEKPDLLVGYMSYRAAMIERYVNNDLDKALALILRGKDNVNAEWNRIENSNPAVDAAILASLKEQYRYSIDDLNKFELDLYLNAPHLKEKAVKRFEEAVNGPEKDNAVVHLAYAQLLEQSGQPERAEMMYKKAMELDPNNDLAAYNLGVMHFTKGGELSRASLETDDMKHAESLKEQADALFNKSYPYFQKVIEITPCDRQTLKALQNIAMQLERMDDFKKYREMEKSCDN